MMELWNEFDRLVVFDTETTGIEFGTDRIIEIGAAALENGEEQGGFNALIRLPAGQTLPHFITQLTGITDEQLDWLMGENGRDVTAEKTKAASLQGQVDDLTKQLNTAKDGLKAFEGVDVADLKGQITKLQGQLTDQADSFAFDAALDGAIRDARGRDVKAIRGMLDVAALKASKDRTSDIKTALDALVKGKAWAFDAAPGGYPNVKDGGEAAARGKGGMVDGVEAAFASMNPNLKV